MSTDKIQVTLGLEKSYPNIISRFEDLIKYHAQREEYEICGTIKKAIDNLKKS